MDKASVYGTEDSGFDSQARLFSTTLLVKWYHVCLPSKSFGFDSRTVYSFFTFCLIPKFPGPEAPATRAFWKFLRAKLELPRK